MTARPLARFIGVAALVCALSGCIEMEMDVNVKDDGSGEATYLLTAKKAVYKRMQEESAQKHEPIGSPFAELEKQKGMKVLEKSDFDSDAGHTWKVRVAFDEIHDVAPRGGDSPADISFRFKREYKFLYTDYTFEIHHASKDSGKPTDPAEKQMMEALSDAFKLKVKVTLPGDITDAPKATVQGDTATYDYDLEQLGTTGDSLIHAKKWNLPLFAGVGVLVGALGFAVVRRATGSRAPVRERTFINPSLMSPPPSPPSPLQPLPVARVAPPAPTPRPAVSPRPTPAPVGADLLRFPCPHCGARLTTKSSLHGRPISCPKCKQTLTVP